jgi:C4-dicarboxylate-specific signal transduction histidine kinase
MCVAIVHEITMNDVKTALADATNSTGFLNRLLAVDRALELAEMISGIAHELSQPLAAMATFSQAGTRMLDRPDPLTSRSLDVFREISQEALQAGARLQSLRRLFESGPPLQTRCRMAELVAEVRPVLDVLALDVGAQLKIEIAAELPEVFIERLKIQRVLLALVRNAADASAAMHDDRAIRIELSAERYGVETSVTDLGAGVAADMRVQMFRPFFTTKPSGHGLGLSSSRAIVESHGGTIGFDNIPTGGVRFWFKLPFAS